LKIFIKYHLLSIFIVIIAHTISYGAASNYSQQSINSIKAIVDDEIITYLTLKNTYGLLMKIPCI